MANVVSRRPTLLPAESFGQCRHCRRIAELGDGRCLRCWDAIEGRNDDARRAVPEPTPVDLYSRDRRIRRLRTEGATLMAIARAVGVSKRQVVRVLAGRRT